MVREKPIPILCSKHFLKVDDEVLNVNGTRLIFVESFLFLLNLVGIYVTIFQAK